MERVECWDRRGEGLERAGQHQRRELDEAHPPQQGADSFTVRFRQAARVDSGPELVFEQSTGHHVFLTSSSPKDRLQLA